MIVFRNYKMQAEEDKTFTNSYQAKIWLWHPRLYQRKNFNKDVQYAQPIVIQTLKQQYKLKVVSLMPHSRNGQNEVK